MFEKVKEIVERIGKNNDTLRNYDARVRNAKSVREMKEIQKEIEDTGFRRDIYTLENKILYDNAQIELFREVMPKALGIWNSYKGKPYGEKTKDKIKNEIREATGCWFYASNEQYGGDTFNLVVDCETEQTLYYFFQCMAFEIYSPQHSKKFFDGNKILPVDFEELKLGYCNDYVEDAHKEAVEIYEERNKLEAEFKELEKKVHDLNMRVPSLCEHVTLGYPRFYDVA